jgi:hypothetical protein
MSEAALYLRKGAVAPAPAAGDAAIILDTDGVIKAVDNDGVKTALGGGLTSGVVSTKVGSNPNAALTIVIDPIAANGVTDDTQALKNWIASVPANQGAEIILPAGDILLSSNVLASAMAGLTFTGRGRAATRLVAKSTYNGDLLTLQNCIDTKIRDLTCTAQAARTGGGYIVISGGSPTIHLPGFALNAACCFVDRVDMDSMFNGVVMQDSSPANGCWQVYVRGGFYRGVSPGGVAVWMNSTDQVAGFPAGGSMFCEDLWILGADAPPANTYGIRVQGTSDFTLSRCETWGLTNGLRIDPGAGQTVEAGNIIGCFFDFSAAECAVIKAVTGSNVTQILIDNTWFAGGTKGLFIDGSGGGNLSYTAISNSRFYANSALGLETLSQTNATVTGCQFQGNVVQDLYFAGNGVGNTATGNRCSSPGANGIQVDAANNNYVLSGNNTAGSLGIVDNGTAPRAVGNNL